MQVEQIDRDAAAGLFRDKRTNLAVKFRLGANPEPLLEAFARHRHQARAEVVGEIVAWLRDSDEAFATTDWEIADQIEAKFGGRDNAV